MEIITVVIGISIIGPIFCKFCLSRHKHEQWDEGKGRNKKTMIKCDNCKMISRRY